MFVLHMANLMITPRFQGKNMLVPRSHDAKKDLQAGEL